jgi:hypothetical protein
VIDQDMVINIELDEAAQRLRLYSVVGRPEGERFGLLLEANYLGQGTDGGSLGLQPDTGTAVLSREVPVAQLDVPGFSAALERFINLTEDWTKRLQAAESEPAANTYAPPPQGGIRA